METGIYENSRTIEQHIAAKNPHSITKEAVGLGNVPNVATNDQAPTFTQAASRENIGSGEKLSILFGKIKKWFADLKPVAFTGSYNDLANKPTIPVASGAAPKAAGLASSGSLAAYARGDHVHPLQTSVSGSSGSCTGNAATATKATQDGSGNVITDTYAKRSIYGDTVIGVGRRVMTTIGECSAALGKRNTASGSYSSALGGSENTASGYCSAALGYGNTASGGYSSALGGDGNTASGYYSSTLGGYRLSSGNVSSAAHGHYNAQMATGGNIANTTGTAFVIGNGTSASTLSNAFSVMFNGVVKAKSTITGSTTADYAEFFEWLDGNPEGEDRVGRFVSLAGNKIVIAESNSNYILGIVSGEPFVLGNGDCDTWNGMYLKDDFNRTIYELAPKMELDEGTGELVPAVDEDGNLVYEGTRPKLNPKYDPTQPYISRFDRKEWAPVGMLGVLSVIDDGTCIPGRFCKCGTNGIATLAGERGYDTFFVIERKTDNIVSVVLK